MIRKNPKQMEMQQNRIENPYNNSLHKNKKQLKIIIKKNSHLKQFLKNK